MKHFISTLRSSILAGVCVGLAGFGYLAEKSIIGAVVFSFGLLAVVAYRLKLYTGTAGFFRRGEFGQLMFILFGNIVGCLLVGLLARCSPMPIQETAQSVLEARLANGPLFGGLLAVGCGFIMTTVVTFAREGKPLILLFGVPLFINCGFPHCLADAFYYLATPLSYTSEHIADILVLYPCLVVGNFIGCNLYRFVMPKQ